MLRLALPNISNVWQITLKDTSLISVTGLSGNYEAILYSSWVNKRSSIFLLFCSSTIFIFNFFKYANV